MFSLLAGSLSRPQSEGNHQMDVEARMELRDIENVKPHTLIFSRQDVCYICSFIVSGQYLDIYILYAIVC